MPVKSLAPVVVRFDVDMKDETVFAKFLVPFLGDVWAEVRVGAIRMFDGIYTQQVGDQRIRVGQAIRNEMNCLSGADNWRRKWH